MSDKICPNGHVYVGNRCDRDNWVEPAEEVKVLESKSTESTKEVESKSVSRRKAVQKAVKKVVSKKVAKKTKKSKK